VEDGDYADFFLYWFHEQIRSTSLDVKVQLKRTLFPNLYDEIMDEDAVTGEDEFDLDNMSWEASDDEEVGNYKDQGAKEVKEVKQHEELVAKDDLDVMDTDELIAAFRKVDLDSISREEKEEEARLTNMRSDAMDTGI